MVPCSLLFKSILHLFYSCKILSKNVKVFLFNFLLLPEQYFLQFLYPFIWVFILHVKGMIFFFFSSPFIFKREILTSQSEALHAWARTKNSSLVAFSVGYLFHKKPPSIRICSNFVLGQTSSPERNYPIFDQRAQFKKEEGAE